MIIDPLVSQTLGRLAGISEFLDLLDQALPETEWNDNEALKQAAESESWEFADFDIERQVLDEKFKFWLPRFTAYSVITLLHTVVETQLLACTKRAASIRTTPFRPDDIRGRGIDAAVLYLERIGLYHVRSDVAWTTICDLRELRHLIVHRAGTKGESDQHRQTARRLADNYEPC